MNLIIENMGIIAKAQIQLNGITVVAGENDSGKSTIGRILYSLLGSEKNLAKESLGDEFGNPKSGMVSLCNGDEEVLIVDFNTDSASINGGIPFDSVFYLESPYVLDELDIHIKTGHELHGHRKKIDLLDKLKRQSTHSPKSIVSSELKAQIDNIVNGRFETGDEGLIYISGNSSVNARYMAAGLKTYSIIKILMDNNALNQQSMFIFDEPEIHLHPQWQVELAQLLVCIHKELGTSLLINTHSPYFLRALQLFLKKYDASNVAKFYFSKRDRAGNGVITDVTDDLVDVYAALSKPFENLWELSNIYD